MPADLCGRWQKTIDAIRTLESLILPRCYCLNEIENPIERVELHGFSDASLAAYGACVYFKFFKRNEEVSVALVAAKSRVSPLKSKQTIPRLELLGNVILSRLVCSILKAL